MIEILWVALVWIFFSTVVAGLAVSYGRSWVGYLFMSLIFSPLISIVILFAEGRDGEALEQRQIKAHKLVKCSFCKEAIKIDAIKCKHCGSDCMKVSVPN